MKILLFLIIVLLSSDMVIPQGIPNYPERNITSSTDSLKRALTTLDETEGVINPDEYIVGPGDVLSIVVKGIDELYFEQYINHEGILILPKIGFVNISGLTLTNAKVKIEKEINKVFQNVNVFTSLVQFRKIKITLIGSVEKPSTYIFKSNARLFDVITSSNGLLPDSDLRNIKISNNNRIRSFDLLRFMRSGDLSHNPHINEGDIIIINRADRMISIFGSIAYPGIYEFIAGETAFELINLVGGLLHRARLDTIEIIRFEPDFRNQKSIYISYDEIKEQNIQLQFGDIVVVRDKAYFMESQLVSIEGFVKYPGYYNIIEDKTTLKEIIEQAGGFKEKASLTEASLFRHIKDEVLDPEFERLKLIPRVDMTEDEYDYFKAKTRQRRGRMVVDFYNLFMNKNEEENILLKKNDYIYIPEETNYVTMLGQVANPGKIVYSPELTINDYIDLSGGFAWRALEKKVRLIKGSSGEWIDAEDVKNIEPGDVIWIPEDPPGPKFWDVFTESLTILGQVASIIAATVAVIIATR